MKNEQVKTAKDIADKLGVHRGTVSKALSGSSEISEETKSLVLAACKKYNYVPNALGRSLKTNKTNTIIVHHPFTTSNNDKTLEDDKFLDIFFLRFLDGVGLACNEYRYSVILSIGANDTMEQNDTIDLLRKRQADGVIVLSPLANDFCVNELVKNKIPFVVGNTEENIGERGKCVDIDNEHKAYWATKYLISRGHTKIGVVVEPQKSTPGRDFSKGVKRAFAEAGEDIPDCMFKNITGECHDCYQLAKELLEEENITAILTPLNDMSFVIQRCVNDLKRRVLVLAESSPLWLYLNPNIPYIKSPIKKLGMEMAASLIKIIENKDEKKATKMLYSKIIDENGDEFN